MQRITLLFCLCLAAQAFAQEPPSPAQLAVSAILGQYSINPLSLVPDTDKPLPKNGKWSTRNARPDNCPSDATPCVRVVYTVAEAHIVCEWTVVPAQGKTPAAFLDENEEAAHYLLRKLTSADVAPLVLTSPQPMYPPIARAAHVSGLVVVQVVVSGEGTVTSANLVNGPAMLAGSAIDAAKHWTFRPLKVGTQSAPFVVNLSVNFAMASSFTTDATVNMHP